jgi:predicted PurR-regulated permease PerM
VVAIAVAGLGFGMVQLGTPAIHWLKTAPEQMPRLKEKFQHILRPAARLSEAASSVSSLDPGKGAQPVEVKDNHLTSTVFSWTGNLLTSVGETVALVFLLLAAGDSLLRNLVCVMPTWRDKRQAAEISHAIQLQISGYLFTVSLINLGLGVVVGVLLHLAGMPNATMWGGVAALINFIPYFGPVAGMLAVSLAGLIAFDTLGRALLPACLYCGVHLIEANAVTPFILGSRLTLNPVIIFMALMFCTWLWGITGALLAMPLLVTFKVVSDRIPALAMAGELLSGKGEPKGPR